MTEDEADELLLLMSQLWWTGSLIPDGTLKIWHSSLMHLEKDAAAECVHELATEKPFWHKDFKTGTANIGVPIKIIFLDILNYYSIWIFS